MTQADTVDSVIAQVTEQVDLLITLFGKTLTVYKSKDPSRNLYGTSKKVWYEAVPCTGRCIFNPTAEQISLIGNLQDVDVAILFSRSEMMRKFPHYKENEWLDESDEIEFEEYRFKILKVHPTGRLKERAILLTVMGKNILGEFRE